LQAGPCKRFIQIYIGKTQLVIIIEKMLCRLVYDIADVTTVFKRIVVLNKSQVIRVVVAEY